MKIYNFLLISGLVLGLASFSSCSEDEETMKPVVNNPVVTNPDGGGDNGGGNGGGDENDDDTGGDDNATVAPDFTLKNLSDQDVKLSDYKGKVVVLFFFGNSCPSCVAIAPRVQSTFVTQYSSDDVVVIGIDQWNGTKSSVQGFKNNTGVSFTLLQKGSSVAAQYGTSYDQLAVVDKKGFIRFKGNRSAGSDLSSAKSIVDEYITK